MNEKSELSAKQPSQKRIKYIAERQGAWDICAEPLIYPYHSQVHRSTNLPLSSLILSGSLQALQHFDYPTVRPTEATVTTSPHVLRAHSSTLILDNAAGCGIVYSSPVAKESPAKENRTRGDKTDIERAEANAGDTRLEEENEDTFPREYVIHREVHHLGEANSVSYFVHFHCYTPAPDTVERPTHIPKHFITQYFCPMQKPDG